MFDKAREVLKATSRKEAFSDEPRQPVARARSAPPPFAPVTTRQIVEPRIHQETMQVPPQSQPAQQEGGIGIDIGFFLNMPDRPVGEDGERYQILRVVDGSPADFAGLNPGDLIISVDGRGIFFDKDGLASLNDLRSGGEWISWTDISNEIKGVTIPGRMLPLGTMMRITVRSAIKRSDSECCDYGALREAIVIVGDLRKIRDAARRGKFRANHGWWPPQSTPGGRGGDNDWF